MLKSQHADEYPPGSPILVLLYDYYHGPGWRWEQGTVDHPVHLTVYANRKISGGRYVVLTSHQTVATKNCYRPRRHD